MSDIWDEAQSLTSKIGLVFSGLELLDEALGRNDFAHAKDLLDKLKSALADVRPLADIKAELDELRAKAAADDAAVDNAIDNKFGTGDTT